MKWQDKDIKILKESFGKIKTKEIALSLNRTVDSVYKKAQSLNLKGDRGINRIYSCDDTFFQRANTISSYVAGFIAADGCITNGYLKIMINIKDIQILEYIKRVIQYDGNIYKDNKRNRCSLEIRNGNIINDLQNKWSITERKSLTLQPPKIKLSNKNFYCFVRGYIDGDGSIYTENKDYLRISILGTDNFLNWIKNKINLNCGLSKLQNIYKLRYSGMSAKKVFMLLKDMDTFNLIRKWEDPLNRIDFGKVTV